MNKGSWEGFGFFNIKKYFLTHIYTDIKNRCVCMCITCMYVYIHMSVHTHIHIFFLLLLVFGSRDRQIQPQATVWMATPTLEEKPSAVPHHLQQSGSSLTTDYMLNGDNEGQWTQVQIMSIRSCLSEALPLQNIFYWDHHQKTRCSLWLHFSNQPSLITHSPSSYETNWTRDKVKDQDHQKKATDPSSKEPNAEK